jgi:hypothetical protein
MFDLAYKIVSDWNFETGFEDTDRSNAFISVDENNKFSNNSSSYSIVVDDGNVKHGTYSSSGLLSIYYFTYSSGNTVNLEEVTVGGGAVQGISPRIIIDNFNIPTIIYYDTSIGALRVLRKIISAWEVENIEFLPIPNSVGKRVLDIDYDSYNNILSFSFIYKINDSLSLVRYGSYDGASWSLEDIPNNNISSIIKSVSMNKNSNDETVVVTGTFDGLFAYSDRGGLWGFEEFLTDESGVYESDSEIALSTNMIHIGYIAGSEAKYCIFDSVTMSFVSNYKFVDFSSSSISITLDDKERPLLSYSHIEGETPLTIYLKYATAESDGSLLKSFNLDSSENGFKTGSFSDAVFDQDDHLFILYLKDGVTLYSGLNDAGGSIGSTSTWKDATYRNDLNPSSSSPLMNLSNRYVEFNSDSEQYFQISDTDSIELDQRELFSVSFSIFPNGSTADDQTIFSNDGYNIFLRWIGGNVWIGFNMSTNLVQSESLVSIISKDSYSKISFVYSGYDVKFYINSSITDGFVVNKFDINGYMVSDGSPFVIGARSSSSSNEYSYPLSNISYYEFLNARIGAVRFWKRELSFEEATYSDDSINYRLDLDPYSGSVDYLSIENGFAVNYYYLNGESLSLEDLGGVGTVGLISNSRFDKEERVTNSSGLSFDQTGVKSRNGDINILWSDKEQNTSNIYMLSESGNNRSSRGGGSSFVKSSGFGGNINSKSNIMTDTGASFLRNGVIGGDYINIVSGSNHIGRKIPILEVLGSTQIVVGVYFEDKVSDIGYFIDSNKVNKSTGDILKITDSKLVSATSPVGVSDISGDLHIAWESLYGDEYSIYYKRYRPQLSNDQSLGSVRISSGKSSSSSPSIAISENSTLHLVWNDIDNRYGSVKYTKSTPVIDPIHGAPSVVKWGSSSYGGSDIDISKSLDSYSPKIVVDSNDFIHISFIVKEGDYSNIFYVNNQYGNFSSPIKITSFSGSVGSIDMKISSTNDVLIVMSVEVNGDSDIFSIRREYSTSQWSSSSKVFDSYNRSVSPSVSIGTDNVAYIYWIEETDDQSIMTQATYNMEDGDLSVDTSTAISSSKGESVAVSSVIDDTNTIYAIWEDSRIPVSTSSVNTEIYKNINSTLVPYGFEEDSTVVSSDGEDDSLSNVVVGNRFPDTISENVIHGSSESVDNIKIVFKDDLNSYTTIGGEYPSNMVFGSRVIGIEIEGLKNTLAYRIKNNDEQGSMFSEFYEFSVDKNPNTTLIEWPLSQSSGQKEVCVQLYTIQGLTSIVCSTMFLNESKVFQVSLFNDNNGSIGDLVSTDYNGKTVLTSDNYWVKIKMFTFVSLDSEKVVFDVLMQGNDILDIDTEYSDGYFIGSFNIQPQDNVRYIDGNAKIIAKVVNE